MPRIIEYLLAAILVVEILFIVILTTRYLYVTDINHSALEKTYFLGGIVSGVFAFGAFFVALLANSNQRATSNIQRFESTFYNMLSLQQQIVNDLSYNFTDKETVVESALNPANGRVVKEVIVNKKILGRELFYYSFNIWETHEEQRPLKGMREIIHNRGLKEYENSNIPTYFDHYFRHLYTIIKFVDGTKFLKEDEKYKYTSMLRATLSRYELVWLYYNCLSAVGNEKFKPLIEKYAILKNLRGELLPLCAENRIKFHESQKLKQFNDRKFSNGDYEFFLTTELNNKTAYYIGAFYSKEDLKQGEVLVNSWTEFINSKGDES